MQQSSKHLPRGGDSRSARAAAIALALSLGVGASATAIAGPGDAVPTNIATSGPAESTSAPAWMKKMAGSSAEFGSYVGSGSFYSSAYHDPYVSASLYVRPSLDLGTRFKLALTARLYAEYELTLPDNPTGRRFNPYDIWLSLVSKNLHTFGSSKIVLGGVFRLTVPLSYESRYANLLTGLSIGPTISREFEFGSDPSPEHRFHLALTFIELFSKSIRSSALRGDDPGASSGCNGYTAPGAVSGGPESAGGPDSDRCTGPINQSFGFRHALVTALSRGKLSLAVTFLVDNAFQYEVPRDALTADKAVAQGREDMTWGIISFAYSFNDHWAANVGISSFQTALDSEVRSIRFPFFDFSGANANNFTQGFVSLSGTL